MGTSMIIKTKCNAQHCGASVSEPNLCYVECKIWVNFISVSIFTCRTL
jgi:hypothetical protein